MKKFRVVFVLLFSFLISTSLVKAECDATESNRLQSLAVNVRNSYEIVELEVQESEDFNPPDGLSDEELENYVYKKDFFRIHLNNITEDLYVVVTNRDTKETHTFHYGDTDNGNVHFDVEVGTEINNYIVDVYASDKTNCTSKKLRTMYFTTPMYNTFSESVMCDGIEEFYLCHEYLSVDTSFAKFDTLVEQYRSGKLKEDGTAKPIEEEKGFFGFIKEHKGIVALTILVVVVAGGCITVVIIKKQRSRIV